MEKAAVIGKDIRAAGLPFVPVTTRPAHASWKWSHLLGERSHLQPANNPFLKADKKYSYPAADSMDSVSILMRTLIMGIQIQFDLGKTKTTAKKLKKVLQNA
jgi:hypothetical protein